MPFRCNDVYYVIRTFILTFNEIRTNLHRICHVTSSWVLENIQNILIKYRFTKANGMLIYYCYWKKVL